MLGDQRDLWSSAGLNERGRLLDCRTSLDLEVFSAL